MAAPTHLTDELADRVIRGIDAGLTVKAAGGVAGVPERTLRRWLSVGRKATAGLYRQFAERVDAAKAFAAVGTINDAAKGDWKAAAFLLERLYPDEYGPQRREVKLLRRMVKVLARRVKALQDALASPGVN